MKKEQIAALVVWLVLFMFLSWIGAGIKDIMEKEKSERSDHAEIEY